MRIEERRLYREGTMKRDRIQDWRYDRREGRELYWK